MNLFDDMLLFDEGKKRFVEFQLPGTELRLWEQFLTRTMSDKYFKDLLTATPWRQRTRKMYDKIVLDPRLTAYYGGPNGLTWTPLLLQLKALVEKECELVFNRVLLNYYRDGNDSVAWHCDNIPSNCIHHPIASVTLGDTRIFKVRHKTDKAIPQVSIPLTHGSFVLMGEGMQELYEHQVPKTSRPVGPRINLTFRISKELNEPQQQEILN